MSDDALLLRDFVDPRVPAIPTEKARVPGLTAALRVERRLVEDEEIRTTLDDPCVELLEIVRVRILPPPFLHVQDPRHGRSDGSPLYEVHPQKRFAIATSRGLRRRW